jgi:hypothetical protein
VIVAVGRFTARHAGRIRCDVVADAVAARVGRARVVVVAVDGGFEHAATPCCSGSQTFWLQASPSSQRTTGVAFGVRALTPGVSASLSCDTPPL